MATDWHYPRTELRDLMLKALEEDEVNAFLMFGRRRMGKSRFLLRDIKPAAEKKKWQVLYTDFDEGTSPPAMRLAYDLQQRLYLNLGDIFPHIKGVTIANLFSAELYETKSADRGAPDPYLALDQLIGAFIDQERNRRTLFLFDEFQACALRKGGRTFLAQIRASLNKRSGQAYTLFTGSSTVGLQAIFDDRKGPFFDFATPIDFKPFDDGFVDYCLEKFERSTQRKLNRAEILDAFDELGRVTQNFREFLRKMMFDPDMSVADALESARERFVVDYRFTDQWLSLSAFDQTLLTELAHGAPSLFSQATAKILQDGAHLKELPTRSKVQAALKRLGRQNVLIYLKDEKSWAFNDVEFRRWIRAQQRQ